MRRTPLYIWREFLQYFRGLPPSFGMPVPKSSYCLEQRSHTLFAARPSEEYSLQYPRAGNLRGVVLSLGRFDVGQ